MRLERPKWHEVPKWWPIIEEERGWVSNALAHGGVTLYPVDIYNGLISRNMKLWLAMDGEALMACCVTQIANYQRMRCLSILIISGEKQTKDTDGGMLNGLAHFYPALEEYARTLDCDGMEFGGRGGWSRMANVYGFKPVYLIQRKMLDG